MPEESIIQEKYIDEEQARNYLTQDYKGINLLPGINKRVTIECAAEVLNVSIPTVERMLQDKQLELTRKSILAYIFSHFLYQRPVMEQGEIYED